MVHPFGSQQYCTECESTFGSAKYLNGSVDKQFPSTKGNMYLLRKNSSSPLMVYERAALFLEQFQENRKRYLQNIRKYDSSVIHHHTDKEMWAPKCSHYRLHMPRSMSFMSTNIRKHKNKKNELLPAHPEPDLSIQSEDTDIWDANLNPMPIKMLHKRNSKQLSCESDDDPLEKMIESTLALNRKLSSSGKTQKPKICCIVFLALLWVLLIGKLIDSIQSVLDYLKSKLMDYIIRSWTHWDMSSLVRKKECAKMTLVCFSPLMAVIGALYSCVWIASGINKAFKSTVPDRFVRKFNFKKLSMEDD